jgi:polyphenol oxidase
MFKIVKMMKSQLITVSHAFFTRRGGVSVGPFDSLNTSYSAGDDSLCVDRNLALIGSSLVKPTGTLFTVSQVHGAVVERAPFTGPRVADAMWTNQTKSMLGIRTADCVPILIQDVALGQVAAAHAGWRGVDSNIIVRSVEALISNGSDKRNLRIAIGPCIQKCCFEVDGDLPQKFEKQFGSSVLSQKSEHKQTLDLPACLRVALFGIGISDEQIDIIRECTSCNLDFFSHRRDKGVTGRQLSVICCE